jgi:nicotinate-nucleotide adenylyltransferase
LKHIGILGGSFDPPHHAHLALARVALRELDLDELLWLPAGQPWQKPDVSAAADRVAMTTLMLEEAREPCFHLELCEVHHAGPSYMVDTVRALQARHSEHPAKWFLVIGQDQYSRLHTWHHWEELLGLVTLAVAARGDQAVHTPEPLSHVPHHCVILRMPPLALSSSQIRQAVGQGSDISAWVSAPIARYIDSHHLYKHGQPAHRS